MLAQKKSRQCRNQAGGLEQNDLHTAVKPTYKNRSFEAILQSITSTTMGWPLTAIDRVAIPNLRPRRGPLERFDDPGMVALFGRLYMKGTVSGAFYAHGLESRSRSAKHDSRRDQDSSAEQDYLSIDAGGISTVGVN